MVIDTSAIFAILDDEPEKERFVEAIERDSTRLISSGTALEIWIVTRCKKKEAGIIALDLFFSQSRFEIIDFDERQLKIAEEAYELYGKGMNNGAGLNFGDLFAYALAKAYSEPLLYKGNDFSNTDIEKVVW